MNVGVEALERFIVTQRWFGSKSREVAETTVLESIPLRERDPELHLALVEVRFQPGTHELYQLPLGVRPLDDGWTVGVICAEEDRVSYDAMADPELVRVVARLMREGADIETAQGVAEFRSLPGADFTGDEVRLLGAEQSNSSVVLDEQVVLKAFRRLGPGVNPELEMLGFLTQRGFENIAALRGYYAHTGGQLDTTLGVVQDYVAGSVDGWELAMEDLRSDDPMRFAARAEALGEVTGSLHAVLASDNTDEAFAPAETSAESLGLLTATVDEEIESLFRALPDDQPDLDPIRGRGEEVRERLRALTQVGSAGRVIRHHGDYHLGQVLLDGERWVVLDFEGEPARSVVERRGKRSPLRDVAGMLRSFAYAASASRILNDAPAPEGWEHAAREAFMAGYLRTADQSLLPPGQAAVERLLSVFELEKAVYELRYEMDHRPDWLSIPVAGIVRLLELETEEVAR
jgi:trehalose synthase-fused probable maltokinase